MLHEVSPSDPITMAAVTFLIGGTVLVTCWVPARAASRMDPVKILRES
jgi:ABC-type antimicrobial peptide transport system permease subunit